MYGQAVGDREFPDLGGNDLAGLQRAVCRSWLVLEMITPVGAERRRAATERLAALTPRESEILHMLAEGMSNAGIGQRLHMSETTIKTYMSRILSKLNCSNRVQAALLARDAGAR
jgi:DNA-binding NarL/FixJ family response regulator